LVEIEDFGDLLQRVRDGDQQATGRFVRACEPHIHKAVRSPLRYYRLHNLLDCTDISQAVLADFFRRGLAHRETLRTQTQVLRLLLSMARDKVLDEVRRSRAARRNHNRLESNLPSEWVNLVAHKGPTPIGIASEKELVREVYSRLSEKERILIELRARGLDWIAIARVYGRKPDSVRKRFTRAMRRVGDQLGLSPVSGS
jgi:DNA-directed RNA polymerase specialized sigma24 family protein